jgi:hypothetical protein
MKLNGYSRYLGMVFAALTFLASGGAAVAESNEGESASGDQIQSKIRQ